MAEMNATRDGGGAAIQAGRYVNLAAAAVSVALMGGVAVWGYKLLMRDVTGVPVVRAMEGDMRVAPENPGGEIASHVGLSVNSVPGEGGAAEPEDRLVLAPSTANLQAEDMAVAPEIPSEIPGEEQDVTVTAEADEVPTQDDVVDPLAQATPATLSLDEEEDREGQRVAAVDTAAPLSAEDVLALADQIAAGATPMTELSEGEDVPLEVSVNGVVVDPNLIPDAVPGVRRSLRPTQRPSTRPAVPVIPAAAAPQSAPAAPAPAPVTGAVTTAAIPAGTKLVQLGAFDSADFAASEWARLTQTFPEFFAGKDQLIQQATSGGRTFYRLRATNFADLSDARRFCSALSAEGAACIPVVVR